MAESPGGWAPRPRLRHLQALVLRNVALPTGYGWDSCVSYNIHLQQPRHEPRLAHRSDQLALQPDLYWGAIEYDTSSLPYETIHGPLSSEIIISFYAHRPSSRAAAAAPGCLPGSRYQVLGSPSQQQQQQQQQLETSKQRELHALQLSGTKAHLAAAEADAQSSQASSAISSHSRSQQQQDPQEQEQSAQSSSSSPPSSRASQGQAQQTGTSGASGPGCQAAATQLLSGAEELSAGSTPAEISSYTPGQLIQCHITVDQHDNLHLQVDVLSAVDSSSCTEDRAAGLPIQPQQQPCHPAPLSQGTCTVAASSPSDPAETSRDQPSAAPRLPNSQSCCVDSSNGGDAGSCSAGQDLQAAAAAAAGATNPPSPGTACGAAPAAGADTPCGAAPAAGGDTVLMKQVVLKLEALTPVTPLELKQTPAQQPNQVVVALRGKLYLMPDSTLTPQSSSSTPQPAAESVSAAAAVAGGSNVSTEDGDWSDVEEVAQLPSQDAGLQKQQKVFRWMASNSNSALDTLEAQPSQSLEDMLLQGGLALQAAAGPAVRPLGLLGFFGQVLGLQRTAASEGNIEGKAAAGGAAHQGPVRVYHPGEFVAQMQRLVGLHEQLSSLQARRQQASEQLTSLLSQQQRRHQQQLQLAAAQHALEQQQQLAAAARAALQQQQDQQVQQEQHLQAACAALVAAVSALRVRRERQQQAEEVLEGPQGRGRWRELHQQLVMRRCHLVSKLAVAYQLGPTTRSLLSAPPLADKLDAGWWATGAAALPTMNNSTGSSSSLAEAAGAGARGQRQPTARLLIAGLELSPAVAKRGLEGAMGWDGTHHDEEQRVAAALGYAAHMVQLLAQYLDVPLRFHLLPRSSRSQVADPAPLRQQLAAPAGRGRHPLQLHHPADEPSTSSSTTSADQPISAAVAPLTLPLYYEAGDRTRFAYAIFLLNKNVEQLLAAHGLPSHGPNQLLANLYQLVLVARSALPPCEQPVLSPEPSYHRQPAPAAANGGVAHGNGAVAAGTTTTSTSGGSGGAGSQQGWAQFGGAGGQQLKQPGATGAAGGQGSTEPGPAVFDWFDLLPLPPVDPG